MYIYIYTHTRIYTHIYHWASAIVLVKHEHTHAQRTYLPYQVKFLFHLCAYSKFCLLDACSQFSFKLSCVLWVESMRACMHEDKETHDASLVGVFQSFRRARM